MLLTTSFNPYIMVWTYYCAFVCVWKLQYNELQACHAAPALKKLLSEGGGGGGGGDGGDPDT